MSRRDHRQHRASIEAEERVRRTPDVIALGEPLVELNRHRGSEHLVASCGNDVSNVSVAAARSGASAGVVSAVGDDAFGCMLLDMWAREGVDAAHVRVDPDAPTGIHFATHGEAGHAFSYGRAGSAASLLGPADLPPGAIRIARVLHVSGISQAISTRAADAAFEAMRMARAAVVLVSHDIDFRAGLWPAARAAAVIQAAMTGADIALPGLDDARLMFGDDAPDEVADRCLRWGARVVALKLGAEGCMIAPSERRVEIPPHPVAAVDATGAGDTGLRGRGPDAAPRRGAGGAGRVTPGDPAS